MKKFTVKSWVAEHKTYWSNRAYTTSVIISLLLFIASLFANYGAVLYSSKEVGNSTTDILLQYLPVVNTDIIFSQGALLFVLFVAILLVLEPKRVPFTLKSIALFICIRAVFVIMTHLGPLDDRIATDFDRLRYLSSGADLFFSGHTGLPFLLSLLYWEEKNLRWVFRLCSIIAAVAVILGHLHYTIDVFSAFFIAYGIYHIALVFFKKDSELFKHGLQPASFFSKI